MRGPRSAARLARRYGGVALVTGAAEGLGAAFASALADGGFDLLLVDRQAGLLEERAAELAARRGGEVAAVHADLATDEGLEAVLEAASGREVGLFVSSAGLAAIGPFLDQDRGALEEILATNCRAPMVLGHTLGRAMAGRGRGGIVFVSSLSGLQGTALVAAYAATKAFGLVLGEALWEELRPAGVDVLAVCLGPTRTPGWERSAPRSRGPAFPPVMEPEAAVAETLAALGRGQPSAVAGRLNRLTAALTSRVLPRAFAIRTMGRTMRSLYGR